MRVPISYALHFPERADVAVPTLDLAAVGELTFEPPDLDTFPCLGLAREAGAEGGTAPCVLNAADDVAVEAFREGNLRFPQIIESVERVVDAHRAESVLSFESIAAADAWSSSLASAGGRVGRVSQLL